MCGFILSSCIQKLVRIIIFCNTAHFHLFCSAVCSSCPCCFQVGDPLSYERESWMMDKDEKLQTVPVLHMQGNALVKQKQFREAASKYKEAVLLLKTVQSRVSEGQVDERWEGEREISDCCTGTDIFHLIFPLLLYRWGSRVELVLIRFTSLYSCSQAAGWEDQHPTEKGKQLKAV